MSEVSQEAREVAASILPSIYGALYSPAMGERCVRGILDEGFLIQAFAKFEQSIRQQAERDTLARIEPVGEAGPFAGSDGGFTTAVFHASKVPVGTPLYALPPAPEAGQ